MRGGLLHDPSINQTFDAGWSSPVARQAHNLKVVGSNPTPATKLKARSANTLAGFFAREFAPICRSRGHSMKCQQNQGFLIPYHRVLARPCHTFGT
jgi:hypothetical protein